uniref:Uncharacterized protein n=1 Tax=Timema bartmani TaxID=61472 RepID=A0A7R9EVB6_9NEOP|nr:unnamed protein product [Timema bartmani]
MDTDILNMLAVRALSSSKLSLLIFGKTGKPDKIHNTMEFQEAPGPVQSTLLFTRAMTGDTTSVLFRKGKKLAFDLLPNDKELSSKMLILNDASATLDEVASAGELFILSLYKKENCNSLDELLCRCSGEVCSNSPSPYITMDGEENLQEEDTCPIGTPVYRGNHGHRTAGIAIAHLKEGYAVESTIRAARERKGKQRAPEWYLVRQACYLSGYTKRTIVVSCKASLLPLRVNKERHSGTFCGQVSRLEQNNEHGHFHEHVRCSVSCGQVSRIEQNNEQNNEHENFHGHVRCSFIYTSMVAWSIVELTLNLDWIAGGGEIRTPIPESSRFELESSFFKRFKNA